MSGRDYLREAVGLNRLAGEQRETLAGTLDERDQAIRAAIRHGVTMYRIAKETGLTETAIRKIRDK